MPELKGKDMLSRKTFRKASRATQFFPPGERKRLIDQLIGKHVERIPQTTNVEEYAAWSQAKIEYANQLLYLCVEQGLKVFGTLFPRGTPRPEPEEMEGYLGKEVTFLLQRFYEYLKGLGGNPTGLLVMDELERSQCKKSLRALASYFSKTQRGQEWAKIIVPEPFYVHSELTTMIQVADLVAYVINWAYRTGPIQEPARPELDDYGRLVRQMVFPLDFTDDEGVRRTMWSVHLIEDLRPSAERF